MTDYRHGLMISPVGQVEIRVEFLDAQEQKTDGSAWLQCIPCGREFAVNPDRRLFECPDCEYEITPAEMDYLCRRYVEVIEKTFGPVASRQQEKRGFFLWRFIRSFVARRATRKTLPPSSETP